jgi:hypothetical protein
MIKRWKTEKCNTNTPPEGVPKEPPKYIDWAHEHGGTNEQPLQPPKNRSIGNKSKAKGIKVDLTPATVKALCAYASIEATLKAIYEKYDPVDCYIDDLKYKSNELACSVAQFLVRELGIEGVVNEARVKEEDENQREDYE